MPDSTEICAVEEALAWKQGMQQFINAVFSQRRKVEEALAWKQGMQLSMAHEPHTAPLHEVEEALAWKQGMQQYLCMPEDGCVAS